MENTMNENTTNTTPATETPATEAAKLDPKLAETARLLVSEAMKLGTTWAEYGITATRNLLRQLAASMESAAKVLDKTAENFRMQRQPPTAPQA
jgi:hypothetical protein